MKPGIIALALALSVSGGACSGNSGKAADTTLNRDLSLAAQQRGDQPLDSLSAAERAAAMAPNALNGASTSSSARTPVRRTTTRASTSGSATRRTSGGTVYSSGGTVTSSQERVIKHTKRDAAIGAAAGAVIGATTSKNKVKGGLIGAAVGGILGGVIGNNVDKKKVP